MFHEVEKTYGEHISPESCEAPALVMMVKVLESMIGLSDASSTLDQMMPTRKSTLSDSISFWTFCTPTSGLTWSSS